MALTKRAQTARLERELLQGLGRSLAANDRAPGRFARLGTKRPLDALCREKPETVRETVEELARMRAGWQQISYRKSLRQIVAAARKGGPTINTVGGF